MASIPPSLAVWLLLLVVLQDVKLGSINSFVQSLSCLFYVESRGALLVDDGLHHVRRRPCEGTSNLYRPCSSAVASGKPRISTRIIGGEAAFEGKWPWQVSVFNHGRYICGGSLIAAQWVVSAAHCFHRRQIQNLYQVKLGDFSLLEPSPNEVTSDVKQITIHPDYKGFATSNGDIALMELKYPVTFTSYIWPVPLPQSSTWFPLNAECWVTGWGLISMNEYPETLQELQVELINKDSCGTILRYFLNDYDFHALNQSGVFCAGYRGKRTCEGDSGGPLVCKDQERWILTGIVSWGAVCAKSSQIDFTVYTAVPSYGGWIHKTINSGLL